MARHNYFTSNRQHNPVSLLDSNSKPIHLLSIIYLSPFPTRDEIYNTQSSDTSSSVTMPKKDLHHAPPMKADLGMLHRTARNSHLNTVYLRSRNREPRQRKGSQAYAQRGGEAGPGRALQERGQHTRTAGHGLRAEEEPRGRRPAQSLKRGPDSYVMAWGEAGERHAYTEELGVVCIVSREGEERKRTCRVSHGIILIVCIYK